MKIKRIGNKLIGRIEIGEEVVEILKSICAENKIKSGKISAIGATNKVTIGIFKADEKKYYSTDLEGDFEITSIMGNISSMDGEVYLHLHVNLSDEKLNAFGGHLNSAIISATCEFIIEDYDEEIDRFADEVSGLNLLKI